MNEQIREIKPTLDVIAQRRSYRGEYLPIPVPREDLQRIMQAGLDAPSGCNKQTTSLIAVDDPETLAELRTVIQPPVAETAPAVICVLTQRINAYRGRCFAVQDYSAAIENMLLAIAALGYQSCWYEGHITDTDRIGDQMAKILGVPEEYELVCMLPVGTAAEQPVPPKKKAFGERAWFNHFPVRTIYLAGGCFWGCQKFFDQFRGVMETETGYTNGPEGPVTYKEVCGNSGHAETVKIVYDERMISLPRLLEYYFMVIDPLSINRQGHDTGIQYRTGIYYTEESQLPEIRQVYDAEEKKAGAKLAVEVQKLKNFVPAEEYHQKYLDKNPGGYCHIPSGYFSVKQE